MENQSQVVQKILHPDLGPFIWHVKRFKTGENNNEMKPKYGSVFGGF